MRLKQYITEDDFGDPEMAKAQNRAIYKGQKFWAGVYSLVAHEIMTTTTYENAEKHDFHHSMYMPDDAVNAMAEEEAVFFWVIGYDTSGVIKNPKINVDWHTNIAGFSERAVINNINRLVKVR